MTQALPQILLPTESGQYSSSLGGPIHRFFEQWAVDAPEAIAVRFRDRTLRYAELNSCANRLARHLISSGVGAESRVMVCIDPCLGISVALLAVLKAGGVYVPLEPTYPLARVRLILQDTQPAFILANAELAEKFGLDDFALFRMDTDWPRIQHLPSENLDTAIALSQTAYIFYTSGTTGQPKGVIATHANLIKYILSARQRYAFTNTDIMPAIARFSFSISLFELLSPLTAGGTLQVLDREHVLDVARMAHTLQQITFFHAGPSLLRALVAYLKQRHSDFTAFDKVRHASSGGDMVVPELLEDLKAIFARAEVFVIYGCSEISCMGCTWPVTRDRTITRTYVGGPFDGVTVKVIDEHRNVVPVGAIGEICFAGPGVVKGYLNHDALTAEKFVQIEGQRFYCTGDVGRMSAAGEIEMLGRRDFQIQLRGMRIELAEVELTLRKAPGVRDGVVMARHDATGEKVLVAYVVSHTENAASAVGIRRHMLEHLPDYMVPTFYIRLESLPLNQNMKVDRHALPPLAETNIRAAITARLRAPETSSEKQMAEIWQDLLRIEAVGLDDNFFELGGHSMLAVELILEARRRLGVTLDGMDVLREPLEELASLVDRRLGRARKPTRPSELLRKFDGGFECFHFGIDRSLYGIFNAAVSDSTQQALLICSAIGNENLRSHFVLQRLSRQLAAHNVPVLRFDYFGCGDSLGESIEAGPARWGRDIVDAYLELKRRARDSQVFVLGLRLGATLVWSVRRKLTGSRLILWDPIGAGEEYLTNICAMHRAYVRGLQSLRLGRPPRVVEGGRELLGSTWSDAALGELRALHMNPGDAADLEPIDWLATLPDSLQRPLFRRLGGEQPGSRFKPVDFNCRWSDLASFGHILPDVGFSKTVVNLLADTDD